MKSFSIIITQLAREAKKNESKTEDLQIAEKQIEGIKKLRTGLGQQIAELQSLNVDGCISEAIEALQSEYHNTHLDFPVDGAQGVGISSLLAIASYYGNEAMVKLLIAEKADVNFRGGAYTPLVAACWNYQVRTAQLLIESKADPNAFTNKETPLMVACRTNYHRHDDPKQIAMVTYLVNAGADPNQTRYLWRNHYYALDETISHNGYPITYTNIGVMDILLSNGHLIKNTHDILPALTAEGATTRFQYIASRALLDQHEFISADQANEFVKNRLSEDELMQVRDCHRTALNKITKKPELFDPVMMQLLLQTTILPKDVAGIVVMYWLQPSLQYPNPSWGEWMVVFNKAVDMQARTAAQTQYEQKNGVKYPNLL